MNRKSQPKGRPASPGRPAPQHREPQAPARPAPLRPPPPPAAAASIVRDEEWSGPEHRRFPRARVRVPFALSVGEAEDLRFSATLPSVNVSVSGAFLESSFFLPLGTELRVGFRPADDAPPVLARAEIVRQERLGDRPGYGADGFAIQFLEFFEQSEVTLAKLFVGAKLRSFAEGYLQSKRARGLTNELDRVVDALAAWELRKVLSTEDLWLGSEEPPR